MAAERKTEPRELLVIAREKALEVLKNCIAPIGLQASALAHDGYPQVWARDSMLCYLCAAFVKTDEPIMDSYKASLLTLIKHQSELGHIPNFVDVKTGKAITVGPGAVDSNLWFIVGLYNYFLITNDASFIEQNRASWQKAILWLRYQDSNECGLVEHPEGATWMDLMANRFNSLYANVLYYAALKYSGKLFEHVGNQEEAEKHEKLAADAKRKINLLFWVSLDTKPERLEAEYAEWKIVYSMMQSMFFSKPYYMPYITFRDYTDYCDTLANCLAILFDIAVDDRAQTILRHLWQVGIDQPYPAKAINPPIYPGNKEWREYYRLGNLNIPHQYHNGGIWPMIGGLYICTLVKMGKRDEAREALTRLAEANSQGRRGEWEFNEWLHGITGKPTGAPCQAWSAAMFLAAHGMLFQPEVKNIFASNGGV